MSNASWDPRSLGVKLGQVAQEGEKPGGMRMGLRRDLSPPP